MEIGGEGSISARVYVHRGQLLVFSTVLLQGLGRVTLASHGVFPTTGADAVQLGAAAHAALQASRPLTTIAEFETFAPPLDPLTEGIGVKGRALEKLVRQMPCGQVVAWKGEDVLRLSFDGDGVSAEMNRSLPDGCSDLDLGSALLAGLAASLD